MAVKQKDLFTKRWRAVTVQPDKEATSLHIPLVAMLRWCLKPTVVMRHVPNGELRDPRIAAKLKAMGVLAGSADLEFFWRNEGPIGAPVRNRQPVSVLRALFLELKLPGRKLTEAQAAFGLAMRCMGAEYHVATSVDEAIAILGNRDLIKPNVEVCGQRWGSAE